MLWRSIANVIDSYITATAPARRCGSIVAAMLVAMFAPGSRWIDLAAEFCLQCGQSKQDVCGCELACAGSNSSCHQCCYKQYKRSLEAQGFWDHLFNGTQAFDLAFNKCRTRCDCGSSCLT